MQESSWFSLELAAPELIACVTPVEPLPEPSDIEGLIVTVFHDPDAARSVLTVALAARPVTRPSVPRRTPGTRHDSLAGPLSGDAD
jgi:hypothetical protein